MKLLTLSFLLLIVSCGKSVDTKYVQVERSDESSPQDELSPQFEGYYALPEGGWADVFEDSQTSVSAKGLRLLVLNSDNSTGIIPLASTPLIVPANKIVYYRVTLNYTAANNIKRDVTNSPVVGSFLTEVKISKKDDKIVFEITISDVASVIYKKTVESI
jgi:hypothetical protein